MNAEDRQLLELAAKAADEGICFYGGCWRSQEGYEWNPLINEVDAICLSEKLGVLFKPTFQHLLSIELFAWQGGDEYTAQRRAIVRAAAEIGRGMA